MIEHLLAVAALRNYRRVSLETGTGDAFIPARSLYLDLGFAPCPPFGDYTANPYSVCMSLNLVAGGTKAGSQPGSSPVTIDFPSRNA
jgi:putative acetyltransferase